MQYFFSISLTAASRGRWAGPSRRGPGRPRPGTGSRSAVFARRPSSPRTPTAMFQCLAKIRYNFKKNLFIIVNVHSEKMECKGNSKENTKKIIFLRKHGAQSIEIFFFKLFRMVFATSLFKKFSFIFANRCTLVAA